MKPAIRTLTPEEFPAIQAAAWMHGRNFKSVIRTCWHNGAYRSNCLGDHEGTLQRMRNSEDGHAVLDSIRVNDFVATPAVAYLMGCNRAKGEGPLNPFGVDSLAKAWRKGYTATRDGILMSGNATPRSIPTA